MKMRTTLTAAVLTAAFAFPTAATTSLGDDVGGAERIETAEFMRAITQEAVAAACFLHNGIEPEISRTLLIEAGAGFEMRMDALLNGNEELGIIGGETRKKTVLGLNKIKETWQPVAAAIETLASDPSDQQALKDIKEVDASLSKMLDKLTSVIESDYANPSEVIQSDAMAIEIAGRQAMMSQKIAKYACKIYTGNTSDDVKKLLGDATSVYERSLEALIHGLPELGILPAPTAEIEKKLSEVLEDWNGVRPVIQQIVAEPSVEQSEIIYLFQHMTHEMRQLEEITHAYVIHSKHVK